MTSIFFLFFWQIPDLVFLTVRRRQHVTMLFDLFPLSFIPKLLEKKNMTRICVVLFDLYSIWARGFKILRPRFHCPSFICDNETSLECRGYFLSQRLPVQVVPPQMHTAQVQPCREVSEDQQEPSCLHLCLNPSRLPLWPLGPPSPPRRTVKI